MTFRAKPVTTRKRRTHLDDEERTQFWVTLGFIVIIGLALLILGGAVAVGYYNDHFKVVARVAGVEINRDQWRQAVEIEQFRIQKAEGRIREELSAGTLEPAAGQQRLEQLQARSQSLQDTALEELIDRTLMGSLARQQSLSVSAADVDAAIKEEASTPELRKVQAVFVEPASDPTAEGPTDEQKTAARERAEKALAELEGGADFADVATEYSTDASRDRGGEYGYVDRENPTDDAWIEALFTLEEGGTTAVVEGADGTYRIGRVTEIRPPVDDASFTSQIPESVGLEAYRQTVEAEVLADRLQQKIGDEATAGDVDQVFAYEILVRAAEEADTGEVGGEEVKTSHILYSPADDPQGAAELPEDDAAWETARTEADSAARTLRAVGGQEKRAADFAALAEAESDDVQSGARGGNLGFLPRANLVQEYGDAIFEGEHENGEIIGPVRSQFGWHVIMFVSRRPPPEERVLGIQAQLRKPQADFQAVAREQSDATNAASGGEIGWVAPHQLDEETEKLLFALELGEISQSVRRDDGYHIYTITMREERPIDAARKEQIARNAFEAWYGPQKEAADIYRDPELFGEAIEGA
jgi:parvulin-like peptidyl-prolyl isomerase